MTWNAVWPDGTKAVGQNTTTGQQNTTYVETTVNTDHYFDVGANEDGHHRFVQMAKNETGGMPSDPSIATGMDGVTYLKEINGRVQGFYQNTNGVFQYIPAFLSGTVSLTSTVTYSTIVAVPDDTFGYAWLYKADTSQTGTWGYFKASGGICQAYSMPIRVGNSGTTTLNLRFGNGDQVSALNFTARRDQGASGTYEYRIMYWGT